QAQETVIRDVWKWEKNGWYFQPDSGESSSPLGSLFNKGSNADRAAIAEIKSKFKVTSDVVDVGELIQGDFKQLPVAIEYTGEAPIRIGSENPTPVTALDSTSTRRITKETKQFFVTVGSDDFDGPFDLPLKFTVYYQSVALDQTIRFRGSIRQLF